MYDYKPDYKPEYSGSYQPAYPTEAYQAAYLQAEKRVQERLHFYRHLAAYVIGGASFIAIYLLSSLAAGGLYYPWFIWPMLFWGIGLTFHFLNVFVFSGTHDRQKMIEAEMRRMGIKSEI